MKRIQDYIKSQITSFSHYQINSEDKKNIYRLGTAEWLTAKLVSGKYRKAPLFPVTRKEVFDKIKLSLDKNKPAYFLICFGGYKHYWNPSHPDIDWAELFNILFMIEYLSPILAVHKPGAILEYESEDYITPLMNNYPDDRSDRYEESFNKLIGFLKPHLPKNLKINFVRAKTQYDTSKVFKKLNVLIEKKLKLLETLPSDEKDGLLHKTAENIMWKGKRDLTYLDSKEKLQFIKRSRCMDEAFLELDFVERKNYFVGDNHISLVLSWGTSKDNIDHWLTVGSTFSSSVDFWIGRGILEDRGNKIVPRVVSHTQYDSIKDKLTTITSNLIPLRNFKTVEVYKGNLVFS